MPPDDATKSIDVMSKQLVGIKQAMERMNESGAEYAEYASSLRSMTEQLGKLHEKLLGETLPSPVVVQSKKSPRPEKVMKTVEVFLSNDTPFEFSVEVKESKPVLVVYSDFSSAIFSEESLDAVEFTAEEKWSDLLADYVPCFFPTVYSPTIFDIAFQDNLPLYEISKFALEKVDVSFIKYIDFDACFVKLKIGPDAHIAPDVFIPLLSSLKFSKRYIDEREPPEPKLSPKEAKMWKSIQEGRARLRAEARLHDERVSFRKNIKQYISFIRATRKFDEVQYDNAQEVRKFLVKRQQQLFTTDNKETAMCLSVLLENFDFSLLMEASLMYQLRKQPKALEKTEEIWIEYIKQGAEANSKLAIHRSDSRPEDCEKEVVQIIDNYVSSQDFLRRQRMADIEHLLRNPLQRELLKLYHSVNKKKLNWSNSQKYFLNAAERFEKEGNMTHVPFVFRQLAFKYHTVCVFDGFALMKLAGEDFGGDIDKLYADIVVGLA